MGETGTTTIVRRSAIAGWALNSLLLVVGLAVKFISDVPPWIVVSVMVAAMVLLNVGRWVALQRALGRASPSGR